MNSAVEASVARLERMASLPVDQYKDAITREACSLTNSTLSYFATVNPAQDGLSMIGWSKSAMVNCTMIDKPIDYRLVDTGLWGDAIREKKPVITNDYKSLIKPTKKGYPQGHVNVRRHMNLPIYEGGKVCLVIGVGNKIEEYTNEDAKLLEELMTAVWPTLRSKLAGNSGNRFS